MTPEAQRIAIAEACGWTKCHATGGFPCGIHPVSPNNSDGFQIPLPDYLNDLNAMHEAEKMKGLDWWAYSDHLKEITNTLALHQRDLIHATAAQRAEAFRKTLGLWKE